MTAATAGEPVALSLLSIEADAFDPHPIHLGGRNWHETNCYVDVWIEVLHALGEGGRP